MLGLLHGAWGRGRYGPGLHKAGIGREGKKTNNKALFADRSC